MIVSEKRIAANRANGALSRGPKTPEGKTRSARNATTHGLLAGIVAVRNETKNSSTAPSLLTVTVSNPPTTWNAASSKKWSPLPGVSAARSPSKCT
jgi:hypothetical protein